MYGMTAFDRPWIDYKSCRQYLHLQVAERFTPFTFVVDEFASIGAIDVTQMLKVNISQLQDAGHQLEDRRHLALFKPYDAHGILQGRKKLKVK